MNFALTEDQEIIRHTLRRFMETEVAPGCEARDLSGTFPMKEILGLGELGILGMIIPEEYGGAGLDTVSYAVALEEIGRVCASCATTISVTNSVCCYPIYIFGSDAQKEKYLRPLASGTCIGGMALTEPNAGSDAANIQCKAVLDNDQWVLNGSKLWVTNGTAGKVIIAMAVTGTDSDGRKEISAFIVEPAFDGCTIMEMEGKMGQHASSTAEIHFEDCRVPGENLLGQCGKGYRCALAALDSGRIGIAALCVGLAQACLEAAVGYAKEREAFGGPISRLQAIQFMIAHMATEVDAARYLTYRAACLKDKNGKCPKESSQAKLFASETANRSAYTALQVHGGYGYMREYPIERYYRDARVTTIYEGTSEIQRYVIARNLLRE
jgi:butyryl-CoA dehydrogenase